MTLVIIGLYTIGHYCVILSRDRTYTIGHYRVSLSRDRTYTIGHYRDSLSRDRTYTIGHLPVMSVQFLGPHLYDRSLSCQFSF